MPNKVRPPNAGKGRPLGSRNKAPQRVREAIARALADTSDDLAGWLRKAAQENAASGVEAYARLAEFVTPKQRANEIALTQHARPPSLGIDFRDGGPGRPRSSQSQARLDAEVTARASGAVVIAPGQDWLPGNDDQDDDQATTNNDQGTTS